MSWRDAPVVRRALLIGVVAVLFLPWTPPPVKYASAAMWYQQVGPVPSDYAFEAYDADTGEFLVAVAKSVCLPPESAPDVQIRLGHGAWFGGAGRGQAEAGPQLSPDERARWLDGWDRMREGTCSDVRANPDGTPMWVMSSVVNWPDIDVEDLEVPTQAPRLPIPISEAGPFRIREHAVHVEGTQFDVRVWSGVGYRDSTCPFDVGQGRPLLTTSLQDDNSNDFSDAYFVLCVSARYTGQLPASPS